MRATRQKMHGFIPACMHTSYPRACLHTDNHTCIHNTQTRTKIREHFLRVWEGERARARDEHLREHGTAGANESANNEQQIVPEHQPLRTQGPPTCRVQKPDGGVTAQVPAAGFATRLHHTSTRTRAPTHASNAATQEEETHVMTTGMSPPPTPAVTRRPRMPAMAVPT
jgi:hypothetical protein